MHINWLLVFGVKGFAHHCLLEACHLPGSSNLRADFLSRNHNRGFLNLRLSLI